jgi:hypothetical protein
MSWWRNEMNATSSIWPKSSPLPHVYLMVEGSQCLCCECRSYQSYTDYSLPGLFRFKNNSEKVTHWFLDVIPWAECQQLGYLIRRNRHYSRVGQFWEYNFEVVKEFSYLGSKVNCINNIDGEIHNRILLANRAYYDLCNLFTSRSVFRKTKCLLYKTLILPVALYASETWPLTKRNDIALNTFQRKILKKIYGPIEENGI